jgi:hypothetical protein
MKVTQLRIRRPPECNGSAKALDNVSAGNNHSVIRMWGFEWLSNETVVGLTLENFPMLKRIFGPPRYCERN